MRKECVRRGYVILNIKIDNFFSREIHLLSITRHRNLNLSIYKEKKDENRSFQIGTCIRFTVYTADTGTNNSIKLTTCYPLSMDKKKLL